MTALDVALHDCRDTWAATIQDLASADERIVVVVNDSIGSSKLGGFKEQFPDRTIDVGIAEQNLVGVGAGLANAGKIPFVSAAGCFLSARAMEQIKVDVVYSRYNVKLIGQSPGVAYGDLGATHHSIEDFAWLRTLPGLVVVSPCDRVETEAAVRWAADYEGPVYVRIPRMSIPDIHAEGYEFAPGQASELRQGSDVSIVATGTTVTRALAAASLLSDEGIEARVLSMPTISPLDQKAILSAAAETKGIVTVEEAFVSGLGGAVSELVTDQHPCRVAKIGFSDAFAVTGSAQWLLDWIGASPEGIAERASGLMK